MSIRYRANASKIVSLLLTLGLFSMSAFARHPLDAPFNEEQYNRYEYETLGNKYLQQCNWESNETSTEDQINIPKLGSFDLSAAIDDLIKTLLGKEVTSVDGICKNINQDLIHNGGDNGKHDKISRLIRAIQEMIRSYYEEKQILGIDKFGQPLVGYTHDGSLIGEFVGKDRAGSSFDLGGLAKCQISQQKIEEMLISKFCIEGGKDGNITLSPAQALAANTIDAEGLPAYGGKAGKVEEIKKTADRHYPSGLTGKQLFDDNGTDPDKKDGGFLLAQAKADPYGSTAKAFQSFDKATIVLKTLAAKTKGTDEANATMLPATKAESMDTEDETVELQVRMAPDFFAFADSLSRLLRKEIYDKAEVLKVPGAQDDVLASRALYESREKNVTSTFFRSKRSGLSAIYKAIEDDAKARMASEMLIMTADKGYIADPSEARAALIKPSRRNAFRYAALLQQEKNKMLKLKYAKEIKRKQQMVDIIKQLAYIRASLYREELDKYFVEYLLQKVDESVDL